MARFHFHTQDGRRVTDEDGVELADLDAARAYALRYLAEVLRDDGHGFWRDRTFTVTTTDETGKVLFSIEVKATEPGGASGG